MSRTTQQSVADFCKHVFNRFPFQESMLGVVIFSRELAGITWNPGSPHMNNTSPGEPHHQDFSGSVVTQEQESLH
jgi:hypothetical protein